MADKKRPQVTSDSDWESIPAPTNSDEWESLPGPPGPSAAPSGGTTLAAPVAQEPSFGDKLKALGFLSSRMALNGGFQRQPFGGKPPQNLGDWMGVGSNVLNEAYGTGRASAIAGPEAIPFGAGAGAIHALSQPPSQHPLTDLGATLFGSGLSEIPSLNRFVRPVVGATGTFLGSLAGSKGDQAMGITHETPWGTIGLYSGAAGAAGILGAFASDASPTKQLADRVKSATGVDVPLNVPQATGRFQQLWDMFGQGSQAAKDLSVSQDASYRTAFQKIAGSSLDQVALDDLASTGKTLRKDVVGQYARDWKTANATPVTKEVPTGVLDNDGNMITRTEVTGMKKPKMVDWTDFQAQNGLTDAERESFFRAIRTDPENFVNQLVPGTGANRMRGLLRLRGLIKVLNNSDMANEAGQLSKAVVQQQMDATFKQSIVNGADFAKRITNAGEQLSAVLTPDQVDALNNIAEVAKNANPIKTGAEKTTQGQRSGSYLFNKILFGTVSSGIGVMAGSHIGAGNVGVMLLGGAGGAALAVPTSTLIGRVLADPRMGNLLISASKGSQGAMSALMRSFYQSTNNKEKPEAPTPGSLASRTLGSFLKP